MFGKRRCLAHLHGQTSCSHEMDAIYGGILALSEFIRDDYLKTSELDRKHAYILHNCIDTARFVPGRRMLRCGLPSALRRKILLYCSAAAWSRIRASTSCWKRWRISMTRASSC